MGVVEVAYASSLRPKGINWFGKLEAYPTWPLAKNTTAKLLLRVCYEQAN